MKNGRNDDKKAVKNVLPFKLKLNLMSRGVLTIKCRKNGEFVTVEI